MWDGLVGAEGWFDSVLRETYEDHSRGFGVADLDRMFVSYCCVQMR
jgi:hypothetical protein